MKTLIVFQNPIAGFVDVIQSMKGIKVAVLSFLVIVLVFVKEILILENWVNNFLL